MPRSLRGWSSEEKRWLFRPFSSGFRSGPGLQNAQGSDGQKAIWHREGKTPATGLVSGKGIAVTAVGAAGGIQAPYAMAAERAGEAVHHRTGSPEEIGAASLARDVPSLLTQPGNHTNGSETLQKGARRKLSGGMKRLEQSCA